MKKRSRMNFFKQAGLAGIVSAMLVTGCEIGSDTTTSTTPPIVNPVPNPTGYDIQQADNGAGLEYRFYKDGHHFMSLIDDNGTFNFRPHPGVDVNGWGSSWYAQPFFPGAILGGTLVDVVNADANGITVSASGIVSGAPYLSTWDMDMSFVYDRTNKTVSGSGNYNVDLQGLIDNTTGDLNLFKIASNYLNDVPLLSGGIGDTGDMRFANVQTDSSNFIWDPVALPAHFPGPTTDNLLIDVEGQYNEVDSAAQGKSAIAPAYKPSLQVELISQNSNAVPMIFGGIYNLSKSQDFWEDNIGITPLILKGAPDTFYSFGINFVSQALPGDK